MDDDILDVMMRAYNKFTEKQPRDQAVTVQCGLEAMKRLESLGPPPPPVPGGRFFMTFMGLRVHVNEKLPPNQIRLLTKDDRVVHVIET